MLATKLFRERVDRFDARQASRSDSSKLSDEELELQYLDRLDAGLYTLQRIALILADVCANANPLCRARANRLLHMRTGSSRINKHLIPVGSCLSYFLPLDLPLSLLRLSLAPCLSPFIRLWNNVENVDNEFFLRASI